MPYEVKRDTKKCPKNKPWAAKKKSDGTVMGCHKTPEDAYAQITAIEKSEGKK